MEEEFLDDFIERNLLLRIPKSSALATLLQMSCQSRLESIPSSVSTRDFEIFGNPISKINYFTISSAAIISCKACTIPSNRRPQWKGELLSAHIFISIWLQLFIEVIHQYVFNVECANDVQCRWSHFDYAKVNIRIKSIDVLHHIIIVKLDDINRQFI